MFGPLSPAPPKPAMPALLLSCEQLLLRCREYQTSHLSRSWDTKCVKSHTTSNKSAGSLNYDTLLERHIRLVSPVSEEAGYYHDICGAREFSVR